MEAPGVDGWAAFKVADTVTSFNGYGMGSYSFFNQGVDIFAANAFEVPATLPPSSLHDLLTIFLDASRREGRHPERRQRHRRVVDHRQPGRPGHRGRATRELKLSRGNARWVGADTPAHRSSGQPCGGRNRSVL